MPAAKTLGVAPIDLDGDGWIDLVLAHDTTPNMVSLNQHDGTFKEIGSSAYIAFDANGLARGAMGIDAARFHNDEVLGVAIGNFANEMTALYVADDPIRHGLQFSDQAPVFGLGAPTTPPLKFGLFFFDYDLDGYPDILAANGHLDEEVERVQPKVRYAQKPLLLRNRGDGMFQEVDAFPTPMVAAPCPGSPEGSPRGRIPAVLDRAARGRVRSSVRGRLE